MRHVRIRPDWRDTWHHCYNRTVGTSGDRPLGDTEKEVFVRILLRVAAFYSVRVVAYQFMSNHFHLLLQAPMECPSAEETCRRFERFHHGKRHLVPDSGACKLWQARLRDVSWFMRHLQHLHTAWYNRTRPVRRRGPLWAGRFKNTILEPGAALWACWTYIERNPVRAGIVADPADYRFSSYGAWAQSGHHPLATAATQWLVPALPVGLDNVSLDAVQNELRREFARLAAEDARAPDAAVDAAMAQAGKEPPLTLVARRRVRYWVDGLVIGSALFIHDTMHRTRRSDLHPRHRLAKASDGPAGPERICAWRRLRDIQT